MLAARAVAFLWLGAVAVAAPLPRETAAPPASAQEEPGAATLGPHAPAIEGTWEFRSMTRPDGAHLAPPAGSGVIVIDRGVVLAASYVQATPDRRVGSLWEGRMILTETTFVVRPAKGVRYDSGAAQPVVTSLPPPSSGRVERVPEGIRLVREDGGTITFEAAGRRVQRDADGTVVVHERTSLVPRVPDNLPGRTQ